MSGIEAARKILEVFKQGKKFMALRDLAKEAGFKWAADRSFKLGFNYLIKEGIIVLRQSGWPSEKRGGHLHPKTVILNADLMEFIEKEYSVDAGMLASSGIFIPENREKKLLKQPLGPEQLSKFKNCPDCQRSPVVYITPQKIGVCQKDWAKLADSNFSW